jgi:O-antigen ligase
MASNTISNPIDRTRLAQAADGLMVAVAVSLPWSTSATAILLVLWLLALIPTLEWADVRKELLTAAGGLPVLLFLLGALGMLWADVPLDERWNGLDSFFKLLVIPLLFVQFRRSDRGLWVLAGYGLACAAVLLVSSVFWIWPATVFVRVQDVAVPVKNAATQSGEFVTCIFVLLYLAIDYFERQRWRWLIGVIVVVLGMAVNILYVATGRTALVIMPVLLVLLAVKRLATKGILILLTAAIFCGAAAWFSSPYLRVRTITIWTDVQSYEASNAQNSAGERLEFLRKSAAFVREAPIFGHGTGSIHALFIKSSEGKTGAAGSATTNPHNQTFAVAIQLGLMGALVLWAMWVAHLYLFRGGGFAAWVGLVIVVQNIIGSLFNSHLFDFAQGWVGVAGGMVLKNNPPPKAGAAP